MTSERSCAGSSGMPCHVMTASAPERPLRSHVVISGTGRAGTSFLTRFLGECGLDIGGVSDVHARTRAGLEQNLLTADAAYVVKDPWIFAYCDVVDLKEINIEFLILPIRDLLDASKSRVLQERIKVMDSPWVDLPVAEVSADTPGGILYSLDPVDQARILAVGFHKLVHWATKNDIPIIFLDFPRFARDGDYLCDPLAPVLTPHCSPEQARKAFAALADSSLIRIKDQAKEHDSRDGADLETQLDREALKIVLSEKRNEIGLLENQLHDLSLQLTASQASLAQREEASLELSHRLNDLEQHFDRMAERASLLQLDRDSVRQTLSWKITKPLRSAKRIFTKSDLRGDTNS